MPDVVTDATLSISAMEELMDDDEPVSRVNGDPMLSSPHALAGDPLLSSPAHPGAVGDPMLCEPRLPSPTSHIDPVDGETLDMDMIAWCRINENIFSFAIFYLIKNVFFHNFMKL